LYSERLIRHFKEARLAGELSAPGVSATVENPVCGDILKLSVRVEAGRVAEARFLAKGCTASIACGSAVAEWLEDSVVEELNSRKASEIASLVETEVGGLPEASKHAAKLAAECAVKLISCLAA
jgi:nitrogen fixation NifU-like protein